MAIERIFVRLDVSDSAMIGKGTWGEYDALSSVSIYAQRCADGIAKLFPGASVTVRPEFQLLETRIAIYSPDNDGPFKEEAEAINALMSQIYQDGAWYVKKG